MWFIQALRIVCHENVPEDVLEGVGVGLGGGVVVVELIFSRHPKQSRHISVKTVEYRSCKFLF